MQIIFKYYIGTLSKNWLLSSSVEFEDCIDSVVDDRVPVKYIIKCLSNAQRNEDIGTKLNAIGTDTSFTNKSETHNKLTSQKSPITYPEIGLMFPQNSPLVFY